MSKSVFVYEGRAMIDYDAEPWARRHQTLNDPVEVNRILEEALEPLEGFRRIMARHVEDVPGDAVADVLEALILFARTVASEVIVPRKDV